jgi:hypothetical protein
MFRVSSVHTSYMRIYPRPSPLAVRVLQACQLDLGGYIEYGVFPRATISLALAAKAYAFLN